MVIGLKEGTSSYGHIPVLELTPAQLAENKQRAELLEKRLLEWVHSFPSELEALGIEPEALGNIVGDRLRNYIHSRHQHPVDYESEHDLLIERILEDWKLEGHNPPHSFDEKKFIAFVQKKIDPMLEEIDAIFPGSPRENITYHLTLGSLFSHNIKADLFAMFNSQSLAQAITADHSLSVEDAMAKEQKSRRLHLNNLNALSLDQHIVFDAHGFGQRRAGYTHRIISGADMIIADYLPNIHNIRSEKLFCFDKQQSKGPQQFSYRFGFAKYEVPEGKDHSAYLCLGAAYFFDPRLLAQLKEHRGKDRLDERLLTGFLTIARLADHDYFHHLTLGVKATQMKGPGKQPEFGYTQNIFGNITRQQTLDNATDYEEESVATHYLAMQKLFERQPRIKTRVIEQAVNFLEMAQQLRDRITRPHVFQPKKTSESAEFLAEIYTNRLFSILPYADIHTAVKDQNGKLTTIREQWDGLYHTSHPKPEIATFIGSVKIVPPEERGKPELEDKEHRENIALHRRGIKAVRKEREVKEAQRRDFSCGYFLGEDGLIERLENDLDRGDVQHALGKKHTGELRERVATFKLLMEQVANRVEVGSVDLVGESIMHKGVPLQENGGYVFRAIKDKLPQAADQLMEVVLELGAHTRTYDITTITAKLARLKETWRDATEQKTQGRI